MKIVKKYDMQYYEILCRGSLKSYELDQALYKFLLRIRENGVKWMFEDEDLKNFASGLLYSFEQEGFLSNKELTAYGKEIIETKKCWKELKGDFRLGVLSFKDFTYIVSFSPSFENLDGFQELAVKNSFKGAYETSGGMCVKDIFIGNNCLVGNQGPVKVTCSYDFDADECRYEVDLGRRGKVSFKENNNTFKLLDKTLATAWLNFALENYGAFRYERERVYLNGIPDSNNNLANGAVEEIFSKGGFTAYAPDGDYSIRDIKVNITDMETVRYLLLKYLLGYAEKNYCGYSEIILLVNEFYKLFQSCTELNDKTMNIVADLQKKAYKESRKAYLRLLAYEDLKPERLATDKYVGKPMDFTNLQMNMEQLVEKIVDGLQPLESVTVICKYCYKNAAISRAFNLFSDVLGKKYGACLNLITSTDSGYEQTDSAKEWYDALKHNQNIIFYEFSADKLKSIHDRYYRIKATDGSIFWFKMSGELDALRFPNDFTDGKTANRDITTTTYGRVKEMTVVMVEDTCINGEISKLMEY